jgi:MFS family permease
LGPILAANTITLSLFLGSNFTKIALLTGYFLMGCGAAAIFFVPSGRVWGKRHLFIVGLCILVASSAWAGSAGKNYDSLLGARILQGVGCAPFETLVNAAVGDLYFVHQRGLRMAFTNMAVFGGAFFTPILVGKITHTLTWPWTFFLVSIFCAACLPAVYFLCPETAYRRDDRLNTDMFTHSSSEHVPHTGAGPSAPPTHRRSSSSEAAQGNGVKAADTEKGPHAIGQTGDMAHGATPPKQTYWESLALFNGRKTDENYFKLLLRPFPLFIHPAFFWAMLIQGTMIGWTVFIGVIVAAIFMGPPYFWNEVNAGYTYTGAFIGAIGGFIIAGLLADWSVRYMTKLNKGVYEPEFRIVMVFPMFIIGGIGLYGFGLTASELNSGRFTYIVPLVFFGFEVAGMVIGAISSSLYIVDAYRKWFIIPLGSITKNCLYPPLTLNI